ncbi:hypothetical protein Tco_1570540 [Tanacetum coccineum]
MLSNSPLSSSSQSTDNKDDDEVPGKGDDDLSERNEKRIDSSTQDVNTVGPSINTASETINTGSSNINTASMQSLEATGIFSGAYEDEDVGVEADLNNVEITMNVSPIPTTKIHKDHPKYQIIRDINSATQTRSMTKITKKHAMDRSNQVIFCLCIIYGVYCVPNGCEECLLYGTIEEEVYVCQPPGFEDPQFLDKVYKVYVDDIIFGSTKKSLCVEFEQMMHKRFRLVVLWGVTFFPRVTSKAINDVESSSAKTICGLIIEEINDCIIDVLDKLLGPDIMYVFCACAGFQVTPKVSHLHVVKRIFRYLKGQPKLGLWYPRDSPFDLEAFSNSDYAGASLDRKSTTGGCQFLGKRLISWQCKKQTIVANSTTEAEYVAAAN